MGLSFRLAAWKVLKPGFTKLCQDSAILSITGYGGFFGIEKLGSPTQRLSLLQIQDPSTRSIFSIG